MNIPWFEPTFDSEDKNLISRIMESTFINQGPMNRRFEDELRAYFGVDYAVLTPNGTLALALSMMALGIGAGDEVIVPDLTFIGTASAVKMTGADVVLADVTRDDFTLDPNDFSRRITDRTRAVIPVHLTGRSADMPAIKRIAEKHDIMVIEDAAEAIGSRNKTGLLGTQSRAGCFSLAPTKIITCGQGGFVLTNEKAVYEGIVRLKDHGRLSRSSDLHPVVGFNFKLTDLQAGLASSQFAKLDERIAHAKWLDDLYRDGLEGIKQVQFPERQTGDGGYLMWPDFLCAHRDELCCSLKEEGIHLRPFWPPIHTQPAYEDEYCFPGAEYACSQACWLPSSPSLTQEEIAHVIARIRAFFER